jgi:hypothetical protein
MNLPKLIYWFSSILLSVLLVFTAFMYFFNHEDVRIAFTELGYPVYLIYPLATFKILAVIAILSSKYRFVKNLAYAGIFYNLTLGFIAHLVIGDGVGFLAFLGLCLLLVSYTFDNILRPQHKSGYDI